MEERKIRTDRDEEIDFAEEILGIKLPLSYRQFLLNREEIEEKAGFRLPVFGLPLEPAKEEKEEEGIVLSFQLGDPSRGGFTWIADYEGRIAGLCNRPECNLCNLKERKKLKDFEGGELRVEPVLYQRETKEFYIAHLVFFPKKEITGEESKISVLQATQILRTNRPDLKDKPLACIRLIGDWAVGGKFSHKQPMKRLFFCLTEIVF